MPGLKKLLWGSAATLLVLALVWHFVSRSRELAAPVSSISYQEIESVYAGSRALTDAQRADYLLKLRGVKVRWSGVVEEVDETNMVFVDIDGFFYDVRFPVPREVALGLDRGQKITFVGFIETLESFLWSSCRVVLRDVALEDRSP